MLKKLDFLSFYANYNIFTLSAGLNKIIVNVFINDIKIINKKKSSIIKKVKIKLISTFLIVNISSISFYLDPKIN